MIWLDRVGLVLQFLACFLMAPEIVGGEGLDRIRKSISVSQQLSVYLPLGIGLVVIAWAVTFRMLAEKLHRLIAAGIVSIVAVLVAVVGVLIVRRHVVQHFVEALRDQELLRKRLLTSGAVLFTLGFIFQFAATFR